MISSHFSRIIGLLFKGHLNDNFEKSPTALIRIIVALSRLNNLFNKLFTSAPLEKL
tara:strand:+ start:54 stop:221 length:168 start_codon:yes stop_codon:yes gene_type:complete